MKSNFAVQTDGEAFTSRLSVQLFGKLSVQRGDQAVDGLKAVKVQELFCYLLLHRNRPHPREALAALLWGDVPTAQSKKYLRQALWQLQVALRSRSESRADRALLIEPDWLRLNGSAALCLDVAAFEATYLETHGVPSESLDSGSFAALRNAADLYQGDLLEGWYQDWCTYERDRLRGIYLAVLDKLMGYCEVHEQFDAGLRYGTLSLRYDRARECTHQRLMRMHYLAGDRATALRQYDGCIIALDEELGVKPSEETVALYEGMRGGQLGTRVSPLRELRPRSAGRGLLSDVLGRLSQIESALGEIQREVRQEMRIVKDALNATEGVSGQLPRIANGRRPGPSVPESATDATMGSRQMRLPH